jgi:Small metal-binding protein
MPSSQAQEALKHAELAKKEMKNPRLEESIRLLKDAIDQGKQGHDEPATQSAERALAHLQELTHQSAETPQGDTGY